MSVNDIQKQARLIFSTGKMIRNHVMRILSAHVSLDEGTKGALDISGTQLFALLVLRERGSVTITELAQILEVSPPSASAMVDRLVEKGILTRQHSREDRRKVLVQVSPAAAEQLDQVHEEILQAFAALVEKIGPETAQQWCEVLERVQQALIDEGWGTLTHATVKR
ncbi:MAG TPA: MarR family transcriptional regulator [Firmicutes bacterium]|nr:MarR family transcriptional regulator [Bacillota bacterium]